MGNLPSFDINNHDNASCKHFWVDIVKGDFDPHYAKRICHHCKKFMGWEPHPVNKTGWKLKVKKILRNIEINEAEKKFCHKLLSKDQLSVVQGDVVNEIYNRLYCKYKNK